ncbi:MAG: DUF2807 domain-containing protein [Burkholderiales bacterium]|nr:DUF2807 domain-containing protein [Burkholderiales bacterium]
MDRLFRYLDTVLGMAFAAALAFGVLSAWPGSARAAEAWVTESGPITSEARSVGEFRALEVSGGFTLKVRQGTREAVEVRAASNLLPLVETVVEAPGSGGTLKVRWKQGSRLRISKSPSIEITVVHLRSIASSGSSTVEVESLKAPQLAVSISGSGDVSLRGLAGDELSTRIAGSGDFQAEGQVSRLRVNVSGSGNVQAEDLKAEDVNVAIAGSGNAAVHAGKTLAVSVAGSGDVVYRGDPQVKSSIAGSGSVRKR